MTPTTGLPDYASWRRALVYGLGVSGRAAVGLLRRLGVTVVAADDRPLGQADLGALTADPAVEVQAGGRLAALPPDVEGVVVSPGVPPSRPLIEDAGRRGIPVVAEVELAFPHLDGPVVAVTGSNGKSTTTALTGEVLAAAGWDAVVCGNFGPALSDQVDLAAAPRPRRVYVVELSSFQLEHVARFRARAAAYLNLAPDHLDRYPDLDAYDAAKRRLLELQDEDGVAVVNADDPRTAAARTVARRRSFSRCGPVEDGCWLDGDRVVEAAPGAPPRELFRRRELPLAGEHNLENAMAAALLGVALGADPDAVRRAVGGFRGLPHRMERVAVIAGVTWFDDSKGTNPAATVRSLEGLPDGHVHLILGGRNKGADPRDLVPAVRRKAKRVYLIGEAAGEIAAALATDAPCERTGTLERAVAAAAARARAGDTVLLSPACASFDQFVNYIARGERFQTLVRALEEGAGGEKAGL